MHTDLTPKPMSTNRSAAAGWAMAAATTTLVILGDQISKSLAVSRLMDGPIKGPGPFWFHLVANRGALLGFPLPTWLLFSVVALVMAMAVSALAAATSRRVIVAWGLLVGGAAGNLIDRLQHRPRFPSHAVVDWIASASFPTFNLADVAIISGLVLLAVTTTSSSAPSPRDSDRPVP